jgi:hypothetical protein
MADPDIAFFVGSCEDLPAATAVMDRRGVAIRALSRLV